MANKNQWGNPDIPELEDDYDDSYDFNPRDYYPEYDYDLYQDHEYSEDDYFYDFDDEDY